jgi:hypothetical protein
MNDITIRPVKETDIAKLADFLSEFPEEQRSTQTWMARLQYWWFQNPACKPGHIGGVILLYQNRIVGFTGNIPTKMLWMGSEETVISGTTWRVLPRYRKYSMDLWFAHRDLTRDFVYFNTTATPEVQKLLGRMGYSSYTFAGRNYYYFSAPGQIHIHPLPGIILYALTRVTSLKIRYAKHRNNALQIKAINPDTIGNELDELWQRTRHLYQYTNVRNSDTIKWQVRNKMLHYVYDHEQLKCFFLMYKADDSLYLADIWGEDLEKYFHSIISFLIDIYGSTSKLILPSYSTFMEAEYKRMLLLPGREIQNTCYLYYDKKRFEFNADMSYFTLLQGDYSA